MCNITSLASSGNLEAAGSRTGWDKDSDKDKDKDSDWESKELLPSDLEAATRGLELQRSRKEAALPDEHTALLHAASRPVFYS